MFETETNALEGIMKREIVGLKRMNTDIQSGSMSLLSDKLNMISLINVNEAMRRIKANLT